MLQCDEARSQSLADETNCSALSGSCDRRGVDEYAVNEQ